MKILGVNVGKRNNDYIKTDSNAGFILKGEVVMDLHDVRKEERTDEERQEAEQKKKEVEDLID